MLRADDIFEPGAVLRAADLPGQSQGVDGLRGLATRPPGGVQTADLDFKSVTVDVHADHTARVQASAVVTSTDGSGAHRDTRQVVLRFTERDGKWRIAGADVGADEDLPPEARP